MKGRGWDSLGDCRLWARAGYTYGQGAGAQDKHELNGLLAICSPLIPPRRSQWSVAPACPSLPAQSRATPVFMSLFVRFMCTGRIVLLWSRCQRRSDQQTVKIAAVVSTVCDFRFQFYRWARFLGWLTRRVSDLAASLSWRVIGQLVIGQILVCALWIWSLRLLPVLWSKRKGQRFHLDLLVKGGSVGLCWSYVIFFLFFFSPTMHNSLLWLDAVVELLDFSGHRENALAHSA